ncbi:hypothetical protein QJS10_CPB04g01805 [Acorus calamus]|uniref:Phospholipase A1 EG1, chloroplastic/mitochondrial n=1 Tax=Acorus calamus TaxID=4465 RepID=A0AAV9F0C7_ACOCL|nr:hypothetical protein QJS10_CPB04g01805 [Acorus calamus]
MASSTAFFPTQLQFNPNSTRIPSSVPYRHPVGQRRSTIATGVGPMMTSAASMASTSASEAKSCLSRVWREIQGSDDWEDLVEPLAPLLRDEIVRYGEFVSACYKAFDLDPTSKRYLNCKYGKNSMLSSVGMPNPGYTITKYIYATPDISIPTQTGTCQSRWVGYVAVSTDEEVRRIGRRDVLVTFRGTVTNTEWIANLMSSLAPARLDPHNPRPEVKVESGFLSLYTSNDSTSRFGQGSCREQLLSEISRVLNKYKHEDVSLTLAGHSMGSSLALLLGYDVAELGLNRDVPITVYSFGGPRVGNFAFKSRCEELGVKVLRVVNVNDPVTKMPGVLLNEHLRELGGPWSCSCYAHVGVELALDFFKMKDPSCVHDLETYIHLLRSSCPARERVRKGGEDLMKRVRRFLSENGGEREEWGWEDAVRNVGNLVQSLRP